MKHQAECDRAEVHEGRTDEPQVRDARLGSSEIAVTSRIAYHAVSPAATRPPMSAFPCFLRSSLIEDPITLTGETVWNTCATIVAYTAPAGWPRRRCSWERAPSYPGTRKRWPRRSEFPAAATTA